MSCLVLGSGFVFFCCFLIHGKSKRLGLVGNSLLFLRLCVNRRSTAPSIFKNLWNLDHTSFNLICFTLIFYRGCKSKKYLNFQRATCSQLAVKLRMEELRKCFVYPNQKLTLCCLPPFFLSVCTCLLLFPSTGVSKEASLFPFCPEKSILGGGLKDLSQEYQSTAWRSDKLPVTSSRDGAGQVHTRHLRGEAFSSGHREERHKG